MTLGNSDEAWPIYHVWPIPEWLHACVIRWHVVSMQWLAKHWHDRQPLSNHVRCSLSHIHVTHGSFRSAKSVFGAALSAICVSFIACTNILTFVLLARGSTGCYFTFSLLLSKMSAGFYSRAAGWNWDAVCAPAQDLAPCIPCVSLPNNVLASDWYYEESTSWYGENKVIVSETPKATIFSTPIICHCWAMIWLKLITSTQTKPTQRVFSDLELPDYLWVIYPSASNCFSCHNWQPILQFNNGICYTSLKH